MKRIFLVFLLLVYFVPSVLAAAPSNRFATCDICGYCPPNEPPQSWPKCQACIYPQADPNPLSNDTLKINPDTNTGPTPMPGTWYTMIGCIGTNLGSFTSSGTQAGVVQTLLNLVFTVSGGIAFLYLLYGAFLVLTSQADPEKLNQGKKTIYGSIVGLIFVLFSVFLVNLLGSGILKIPGFGSGPAPTP